MGESDKVYRGHAPLREFPQSKLLEEHRARALELLRRVADWYAERGEIDQAVEHALVAVDHDLAWRVLGEEIWRIMATGRPG